METIIARKMWATLEPYHAMIYFASEAFAAWEELGFPKRGMGYFASRSGAMGRVEPSVVSAVFYNFHPGLVARFLPEAWEIADPPAVVEARYAAADAALRRMLGEEVTSPEMAWSAEAAMEAALACPPDGRPLFAAHAALEAPDEPHMKLWHALTLLREFRGDGHVQSLVSAGISGLEAVVSYAATGELFDAAFYRRSRGWSDDEWADGEELLQAQGWMGTDGVLTDTGRAGRAAIESATDRLAMAPWEAIGQETADRLRATIRPWSRTLAAARDQEAT